MQSENLTPKTLAQENAKNMQKQWKQKCKQTSKKCKFWNCAFFGIFACIIFSWFPRISRSAYHTSLNARLRRLKATYAGMTLCALTQLFCSKLKWTTRKKPYENTFSITFTTVHWASLILFSFPRLGGFDICTPKTLRRLGLIGVMTISDPFSQHKITIIIIVFIYFFNI